MRKAVIVLAGAVALAACLSPMQATAGLLSWLVDAAKEAGVVSTERGTLRSLEEPALRAAKPLEKVPEGTAPKAENTHASGAVENSTKTAPG